MRQRGDDSDGMKLSKKERQRVRDALYQEIEKPWLTAKAEYTAAVRKKIGNVAQQLEKLGIEAVQRICRRSVDRRRPAAAKE